MKRTIGFMGAGQMARALAKGFVAAGQTSAEAVAAYDPSDEARQGFLTVLPGAEIVADARELVAASEIVFLAVKPQHLDSVFAQLATSDSTDCLFVSIVAGATLGRLMKGLDTQRVVRVMPNTPCLVAAGASGYCLAEGVSTYDAERVHALLESVGIACALPESLMDAVTGLSGSGPAFVYQVIEALSDGGVAVGLPRDVSTRLAAQTVLGAAKMVMDSSEHPAVLKDRVASPGGTTIAGLAALESGRLRATLIHAVQQATARSRELGS